MPVVGFLRSTTAAGSEHLVGGVPPGLNEAGFIEGQNVMIEYRWADDSLDRLPELAADLARRPVAVIVANGLAAAAASKAATATTPIVFVTGADPVRTGLVASLNRPGGNVTGVIFTTTDLAAKQLGLLHELVPKAAVIAALQDPNQPEIEVVMRDVEAAGRAIGRQILLVKAAREGEFNAAFATMVQAGAGALLVGGGQAYLSQRRQLVALATRHALPAVYVLREYVEAGGLMSYGSSGTDAYRQVGNYAGRILKGEKPADLPVQLATKFELVINLGTAKAIGLEIPPMLLARALCRRRERRDRIPLGRQSNRPATGAGGRIGSPAWSALIAALGGSPSAFAAKAATATIPIVFNVGDDPVRLGLDASLARPGGNLTGNNIFTTEVSAKRLELLRELVPGAARVAVFVNPAIAATAASTVSDVEAAARATGLQIRVLNASNSREIDVAFATLGRERHDALFIDDGAAFTGRRVQLTQWTARLAIPAIYAFRQHAEVGGLMSYGASLRDVLSPGRHLCRSYPQGRQAGGPAACSRPNMSWPSTARQPESSASKCRPTARPRRRGDRMKRTATTGDRKHLSVRARGIAAI